MTGARSEYRGPKNLTVHWTFGVIHFDIPCPATIHAKALQGERNHGDNKYAIRSWITVWYGFNLALFTPHFPFIFSLLMRSLLILAAATAAYMLPQAIPAFPGAEGFGANAVGGRGGSVYVVTKLNDSGSGSFRDAVSQSKRIVVFAVGGVIKISSRVVVKDHITIAGQTAPGGGITIYGNGVSYSNAHHTITRYVRYRMGKGGDSGKDGIAIADGHDMIFDHVSVSWGRDPFLRLSPLTGMYRILQYPTLSLLKDWRPIPAVV
ncbi:LOW QUALITY PROTEIN: hypothetical protein RSAG8_11050, partial [Rhizoctonia solani AG-8 WAC10335]